MKNIFIDRPGARASALHQAFYLIAGIIGFSLFCALVMNTSSGVSLQGWKVVWRYREVFWNGWLETILLSLAALFLSTLFGILLAAARSSSIIGLRALALLFIEVIRGTPLLTQVLFFFYVVAQGVGLESRMITGVLILSFFSSATIAEMVRGSIETIPRSQRESAKAIGLTKWQTYRYVIAPQALRHLLPSLAGQFAAIIKDSSLLSMIGLSEFTLAAEQVNAVTYQTLESFFPLALGYLLLTLPISLASRWLEKTLHYEH